MTIHVLTKALEDKLLRALLERDAVDKELKELKLLMSNGIGFVIVEEAMEKLNGIAALTDVRNLLLSMWYRKELFKENANRAEQRVAELLTETQLLRKQLAVAIEGLHGQTDTTATIRIVSAVPVRGYK